MNFKIDFSALLKVLGMKVKGQSTNEGPMRVQTGMFEINLVPDVKMKMIKLQKIRNLVFFICIVIVSTMFGGILILGGIKGAQDIAISGQDKKLKSMSDKIMNYSELSEFLTIQDQLGKLAKIDDNKKVLSRVFMVLSGILPNNDNSKTQDSISLSDLNVDLSNSSISFDAQADAKVEPMFDYRVLESFRKSVGLMKYDYGRYVDANGAQIPTRCIEETDENGNIYSQDGSVYAIWKRGEKGCDPSRDDTLETSNVSENISNTQSGVGESENQAEKNEQKPIVKSERIWRTPQFKNWYDGKEEKSSIVGENNSENETMVSYTYRPSMSVDGVISGVPHFESNCVQYVGNADGGEVKWSAINDCMMAPNGANITDSSNGRTSDGNLVLRFSAVIKLDKKIFTYNNKHVMVINPSGQNVTDSYLQIGGMFAEGAKDCAANDSSCNSQKTGGN